MKSINEIRAEKLRKEAMSRIRDEYHFVQTIVNGFMNGEIQANKARRLYHKSYAKAKWYDDIAEHLLHKYDLDYTTEDTCIGAFDVYYVFFEG